MLSIAEFDGDGRYLVHYSVDEFTGTLGTPEDDSTNTFTGRLLLLLESSSLLGEAIYNEIIADVVVRYWRDYADHSDNFIPAFLANDILRLWRTFCVNYEARTERGPEDKKKKGKIKNYKLKHSRLLTCYSALLYLLAIYNRNKTVCPSDVISMTDLTPTERLEWSLKQPDCGDAHEAVQQLIDLYEQFLLTTEDEEALGAKMMDKEGGREYANTTYEFGNKVFNVLNLVGKESRFHRLLVV